MEHGDGRLHPNPTVAYALQRTATLAFSYRCAGPVPTGAVTACAPAAKPSTCRAFASRRFAHPRVPGSRSLSLGSRRHSPSPVKATPFQISSRAILILACLAFASCKSKKGAADSDASKPPPPFDRAEFSEVTPMLDGSAYAKSSDSRLWYLRGNKAVRVSVVANASQKLPEFTEITPVLDGGAYATSWEAESGLWYLHAEHAEKVIEGASLADSTAPKQIPAKAFYALYLSEHKKRKNAEYRADNPAEFAEPSDQLDDRDY